MQCGVDLILIIDYLSFKEAPNIRKAAICDSRALVGAVLKFKRYYAASLHN